NTYRSPLPAARADDGVAAGSERRTARHRHYDLLGSPPVGARGGRQELRQVKPQPRRRSPSSFHPELFSTRSTRPSFLVPDREGRSTPHSYTRTLGLLLLLDREDQVFSVAGTFVSDPMAAAALAVTDEVALPIWAVGDLAAAADVSREEVAVITQCAVLGGKLPFDDGSVGAVLAVIKNVESLREQLVSEINRVLKAGGRVLVQSSAPSSSQKPNTDIERKLLMGGFVEVQASAASSQDTVQSVTIKAKKASWSVGSSFPLKKATKALPKIQIDDDSDLIDEDSLLTEEDLKKPQLPVVGDCEVGATRKACKNCTCGRAEAEEKVEKLELTAEQINNPQSACGSCGLGDAFRCGACPYRGLPPFKPGEKVSLSSNFLAADI
ncbi:unnamed protein product, partial [Urochloa humidicola]